MERRAGMRWTTARPTCVTGTPRSGSTLTRPEPMSSSKGFLLVTMEPPPALEEEFHAWYDTEHVPHSLFFFQAEDGIRDVCTVGWPKYLAFYDLASAEVIESPGYRAI